MTNAHCEHSPRPWMKASPTEGYDLSTLKATQPDAALIARAIEVPHDGDPDCPGVRNKRFLEEHDCHVCMNCGGDLPEQWVKGWCESCAQQVNDAFEEVKRTEAEGTGK